jgi:Na+/H+ antiporter NhaD/arsenite permease-like protein
MVLIPSVAEASDASLGRMHPGWLVPFAAAVLIMVFSEVHHSVEHWWGSWRNRFVVFAALIIPVVIRIAMEPHGIGVLGHQVLEYGQFLCYSFGLYFAALGIVKVAGDLKATPHANTLILATSLIGSNALGSGGYGILVTQILLDSNRERRRTWHTYVMVMWVTCNTIATLFPQSDAPVFLGMLQGMPYFWAVEHLWAPTLFSNSILLLLYFFYDSVQYSKEDLRDLAKDRADTERLRFKGFLGNLLLFAGMIGGMIYFNEERTRNLIGIGVGLREGVLLLGAGLSAFVVSPIKKGPGGLERHGRPFDIVPISNVAFVFALLFFTILPWKPELAYLVGSNGASDPSSLYKLFGAASTIMDNAIAEILGVATLLGLPAYEGTAAIMIQGHPVDPSKFAAVILSTVQFGAFLTFSNWPNLIVWLMAKARGVPMPSPAKFAILSTCILLPVLLLTDYCFFIRGWIYYFM